MSRFAAVIFDMDGVLVDGEPLHFQAVNRLLGEEGRSLELERYKGYMGTKAGWRELIGDLGLRHPEEHYSARYRDLIIEEYRACRTPLPGAVELVVGLRAAGVPLALASSSIRPWVDTCLESIGLAGAFEVLVAGEDVQHGKPDPEIYLLAAARLGVDPARCLAFEDAPAGVASASAAGMTCWAVRTEYTSGLPLPGAVRVLESLTEVDLADILGVPA
ncbi:MAG: HAD family hydrolase [Tepidiformaceae bacterium]